MRTRYQIKMTYTSDDFTAWMIDADTGRRVLSRVPNHPRRPALPFEVQTWWEDIPACLAVLAINAGQLVRLV